MKKKHRTFIAINLPNDVKKYLAGFEKKWADLPAKWTLQDNLHVTVVFLGNLTDEELGEVCIAVKEIASKHHSLDIHLNRVSYGPDDKIPPRFIWASGEKSKDLFLLKKDLQNLLLEKVSFIPELRVFSPHITLARINTFTWRQIEPEERPDVNENIDLVFTVESIEVMESESVRGMLRYIVIESCAFKN